MTKKVNKANKAFDCVALKRRAAEEVQRRLANLSPEERLAHWRQRTESLRRMKAGRGGDGRNHRARSA